MSFSPYIDSVKCQNLLKLTYFNLLDETSAFLGNNEIDICGKLCVPMNLWNVESTVSMG